MSRSYKKNAWLKDRCFDNNEPNKVERRVNKQRVNEGKEPKLRREVINQYNVSDWRFQDLENNYNVKRK